MKTEEPKRFGRFGLEPGPVVEVEVSRHQYFVLPKPRYQCHGTNGARTAAPSYLTKTMESVYPKPRNQRYPDHGTSGSKIIEKRYHDHGTMGTKTSVRKW